MRRKIAGALAFTVACSVCMWAANWPTVGGNPQRDGYVSPETHITAANANGVKLIFKHAFDVKGTVNSIIDLANIIGVTGFHEFLWTSASTGDVWVTDADLNYDYKHVTLEPKEKATGKESALCPGGVTAAPLLAGGSTVGRFGGGGGFRSTTVAVAYVLGEDGVITPLRQQDADPKYVPGQKLVPAGSNVPALNISGDGILFAPTINGCGGAGNGLYAASFKGPETENVPNKPFKTAPQWGPVMSFMTNGAGFAGAGATAIGTKNDYVVGTVPQGKGDVAGDYNDTVLQLDAKTLTVKDYFTPSEKRPAYKPGAVGVTPAVFTEGGKDYIVAGDRNGKVYLLDSTALGGSDHHTPLASTDALVAPDATGNNGIFGTFATFSDADHANTRWVFAAVRGPLKMQFPGGSPAPNGGIVAFKIDFSSGPPKFVPAWSSPDMMGASGPIVAAGVVYGLASGVSGKGNKAASLVLLNAQTGSVLYKSEPASTYSTQPLSFAAGHAYFVTHDNTLYQYGIPEEK
jgi:hypothetical protein